MISSRVVSRREWIHSSSITSISFKFLYCSLFLSPCLIQRQTTAFPCLHRRSSSPTEAPKAPEGFAAHWCAAGRRTSRLIKKQKTNGWNVCDSSALPKICEFWRPSVSVGFFRVPPIWKGTSPKIGSYRKLLDSKCSWMFILHTMFLVFLNIRAFTVFQWFNIVP